MATATQETGTSRTPGYPYIPEETWWRLRKLFQDKGAPRPAWNEDYLINMGLRQTKRSARNLVRPFKRMGLFTEDGKPTARYWDWLDNAKYPEVCAQILHELYPEDATHVFTTADDDTRDRLEKWFQRNQGVAPNVAAQYAILFILLVEADPSKQDGATTPKTPRAPKVSGPRSSNPSRPAGTKAASAGGHETRTAGVHIEQNGHERSEQGTPQRAPRSFEPSLNINIQIHISAEATADQIDQIFKSMGKHLYQRQDEADA